MYYPILRGKQNELLALRECSGKLAQSNSVVPIIDPVKKEKAGLLTCLRELNDKKIRHILICNPLVGYYSNNRRDLNNLVVGLLNGADSDKFLYTEFAYWVGEGTLLAELVDFKTLVNDRSYSFIHQSHYAKFGELQDFSADRNFKTHFFIKDQTSRRYQEGFSNNNRVVVSDCFNKLKRNADYRGSEDEFFSDLHVTFSEDGFQGFGDFSIVGNHYSETGGLAYTAAIHYLYERSVDEEIWIRHFLSETYEVDPEAAVLIQECLDELVVFMDENPDIYEYSQASLEFKRLHEERRPTTLGYIKKISIKHHLELMIHLLTPGS